MINKYRTYTYITYTYKRIHNNNELLRIEKAKDFEEEIPENIPSVNTALTEIKRIKYKKEIENLREFKKAFK